MNHSKLNLVWITLVCWAAASSLFGAGTLTPMESAQQPIQIQDHHVNVTINNGFSRTEVTQTFFNPNNTDLEAIYSFPIPEGASLSEMTIYAGERELHGEVLERDKAAEIYEEERDQGNDAGLASKNSYQTFDFLVSPVRAQDTTQVRFVYYQPLEIDTGIGRYVYPLENGGTDEMAAQFWLEHSRVEQSFAVDLELKSAWPIADVRVPGFESQASIQEIETDRYRVRLDLADASLDRDFVFYYRLEDNLPGRVELIPYRASESEPGTFMLVLTPALDLQPLNNGADYTFVLDVSGSMQGKIAMLADGVSRALGELKPQDRFRIIQFNNRASSVTQGWRPATPEEVQRAVRKVKSIRAGGSTNLYDGLQLGLDDLDDDRASSVVLVTDAVTNTGVIEPRQFHQLMHKVDVRVFGFLLGNSGNWPLMHTICETSGGYWTQVSNQDDILGQLLLAKSKMTHEALHDAELKISGVKVFGTTQGALGKVYRGQQVILFGRYQEGGTATVTLKARLSGADKVYKTVVDFPNVDTDNPELERLWAMHRIEAFETQEQAGLLPPDESEQAIRDLGVAYQLVTDHTSMVVLTDEAFAARGIERWNQRRIAIERQAQIDRAQQGTRNFRVDRNRPMFNGTAPRGGGIGAIDPGTALLVLGLAGFGWRATRKRR